MKPRPESCTRSTVTARSPRICRCFNRSPPLAGGFYSTPGFQPSGCIPGFMPGLKAIYERFCTKPWGYLVDEAIGWAEDGHIVSSFEHQVYIETLPFCAYFPDGQDFFMPGGFVPAVGSRMRNLPLAQTLRALAAEGPEYFISGEWARRFVAKANAMGWAIGLDDLSVSPPFEEPLRYRHRDLELVHLPLPQEAGLMSMLVLGVVANVQGASGPLDSPNAVRTMAMALRLALQQCGYLNDPLHFAVPLDTWSDPAFHRQSRVDRREQLARRRSHVARGEDVGKGTPYRRRPAARTRRTAQNSPAEAANSRSSMLTAIGSR